LQLCTPLREKCNGKDGYGICLVRNKEEIGIGKMPPKVDVTGGRIMFVFTGDDCTPKTKYTVNIIMKCDYEAGSNSYPEIFDYASEQCNLYLSWKSIFACAPPKQINCTVTDNGFHYDLSSLTRYSENYVIHTGNNTSPKIILNVCHSVIFEHNALCQMESGACLQEIVSSKTEYVNLGDVKHSPFIEDGKLKLQYQEGAICKVKNETTPHIGTTISFICDFEAIDTVPEYVGSESCDYQLIWKTAAACSVESLRNHSATTAGKCTVNNPLTNFTYNLQTLMNKDFHTIAKNGTEYKFGICKAPVNTGCTSGTGVCLTKNSVSMGKVNTNLMWEEGGPYLNYTDGDLCENGQRRYTIIAFLCGAEGSSEEPLVMEQNSCQLIIHWNTNLVCEKRVKCATDDDEVNLSSLIKSTSNYIIKVNKTEFHINVCRPLVPVPGLTCAHGSAVCKTSLSSDKEYINEVSLGFPKESPIVNKNHETVLRYFPELKKYEDCTYIFEWKTSITCGAVMGNWTPPCTIKEQWLSHECNLSLLHKDKKIYYVKNKQGKEYSISICGGEKICNGSAVCQGNNGYGSLTNVIFDYGRNVIKLKYSNGGKCIDSKTSYTSEVRFICNESVGIGTPKLLWETTGTVVPLFV
ncbi:Cation-independent mannose-6-phosphate receptor, partial [Habropoda laboriosa]